MKKVYLISSGEYSDYIVGFILETNRDVEEGEFRQYWLQAIKLKTEYVDSKLLLIANYLKVSQQPTIWDYCDLVSPEKYNEALNAVDYQHKGIEDCFKEILLKEGFVQLSYTEFNTDDF